MDKNTQLLSEILKWQKFQGIQLLKTILPNILESKEKKMVYELTDGETTVKEISKKAGVATGTVSAWWNTWLANGIVSKEISRYKKIVSLKDIGLLIFKENGKQTTN